MAEKRVCARLWGEKSGKFFLCLLSVYADGGKIIFVIFFHFMRRERELIHDNNKNERSKKSEGRKSSCAIGNYRLNAALKEKCRRRRFSSFRWVLRFRVRLKLLESDRKAQIVKVLQVLSLLQAACWHYKALTRPAVWSLSRCRICLHEIMLNNANGKALNPFEILISSINKTNNLSDIKQHAKGVKKSSRSSS